MEYESAQQTAQRLGVTVRAVQKWAAAGRIPDARKIGRTWFIPKGAQVMDEPAGKNMTKSEHNDTNIDDIPDEQQISSSRMAMTLINTQYSVGHILEYIQAMNDEDDRAITLGEYYYHSGRGEEAVRIMEVYLNSQNPTLRYTAAFISAFANLTGGHTHRAKFALNMLRDLMMEGLRPDAPVRSRVLSAFTLNAANVFFHLPIPPQVPPLETYVRYLPGGVKLWACYILAHKAYLEKDYSRALAIADMGLMMCPMDYPIAQIYVHLAAVMALMSMKRTEEARAHMAKAWELAQPDDLIQPFADHHGLLHGMIEVFFKKDYPRVFERIVSLAQKFRRSWSKIHNSEAKADVADNLTTTEFTVAMLYNRGWSAQEIAVHMELSEHTIRGYIKTIYIKLGISDRSGLEQFMLR